MYKLALTAGHYLYTAGKRCLKSIDPNETREWWLNDRIVDRIQVLLTDYEGIEVLRTDDTTGETDRSLTTRTNAANNFKADFYLSVHHNAGVNGGTGGGIETYVYTSVDSDTLDWQNKLYNELIALTGLKGNRSDGTRSANLHEVRETHMPAVLLELGFMDSTTDVPIILTQDFAYKCAQACVNVIVKKAGLKKKTTNTTTVGSTYKVVTSINRYASVADAQAKTNSKGEYEAGTYYIFNKYPNGLNGMYNISKDSTGASAGSWINPSENKIEEVKEEVQKLYRVRTSWTDSKSQVGAYSSLDNAKDACQKAGNGYKVFDWNGKEIYSYVAPIIENKPVQPEIPVATEPKKVYELDFPVKHKICEYKTIEENDYKKYFTQCCETILKNNSVFDINIVKAFFTLAPIYGIDPIRAISQSILETGWFKYQGSAVKPEHHNYCGLGVTTTGKPGNIFNNVEDGVRAQLQHLFAYGSKDNLPEGETLLDQRFKYVTRGIAPTWEELAGRWAVPGFDADDPQVAISNGTTYGQKIDKIYQSIIKSSISDEDVKKYFDEITPQEPTDTEITLEPEAEPNQPKQEDKKEIDTDKVNTILDILIKILNFIVNFFKKG